MFRLNKVVNSSLWITVLVVRVGCIIEAHPSPNNINGHKLSHHAAYENPLHQTVELETAASHSFIASPINGLLDGGVLGSLPKKQHQLPTSIHYAEELGKIKTQQQNLGDEGKVVFISTRRIADEKTPVTSSTASPEASLVARTQQQQQKQEHETSGSISRGQNDDDNSNISGENDDTCSGKADGYYQNLGSGCTSYYFCTSGYQATYICPIGSKFNGKRCENEYVCPTTTSDGHHISNDCENKSNGYYPANSRINVGKYFYCFQKAKVIELQCDPGKIFVKDKCVLPSSGTFTAPIVQGMSQGETETAAVREMNGGANSEEATAAADTICYGKSNGFYQDRKSNCEKYYYCIGGDKTGLRCQDEYVFNGDICVHHSRYECPHAFVKTEDESQQSELKLAGVGSIDQRETTDAKSTRSGSELTTTTDSSGRNTGNGKIVTEAGKLPIISGELSSLENDYYSSRDSSDRRMSTTTMNSSHLNAS